MYIVQLDYTKLFGMATSYINDVILAVALGRSLECKTGFSLNNPPVTHSIVSANGRDCLGPTSFMKITS